MKLPEGALAQHVIALGKTGAGKRTWAQRLARKRVADTLQILWEDFARWAPSIIRSREWLS